MRRMIFLALLVSVSRAASENKCDPASDASCPSGENDADADVMLQTRTRFHNKGSTPTETQDSCGQYGLASCPAQCEWFAPNHVCQTPCALFTNEDDCPARCDWSHGKCTEHDLDNGNPSYSGPDKSAPVPTTVDEATHNDMEKHFGPGSDLILALPIVLQNLSRVSTMITVTQDKKSAGLVDSDHTFGDANKDEAYILDNVAGFFTTLHADSHAMTSGATAKCPKNDITVIKSCVELALCEVQSHLDDNPNVKKAYLSIYSLLEHLAAGFADITYGLLDTSLKHEASGASMISFEATDSFLDASHYTCASGATVLAQEDGSNKAYHTSAVLQAAAKVTHTVLDSHSQNSSAEATLEALHQAWKPSCELLNCDHTNYFDLYGASHVHSLALIEAGASGQHMRTHIRTRHRLEVRMMRFLSEHATQFSKNGKLALYQAEGTQTDARLKHYFSLLREPLMSFAESYPKTKTEDELYVLASEQVIKRYYEGRQAVDDGSQGGLENNGPETQIAEEHQNDQLDDSELDTGLSEIAEEDAKLAGRRRRRRFFRRRRRRWFIQEAVNTVANAVTTAWNFIAEAFACAGKAAIIQGEGYGKKFSGPEAMTGCSISVGATHSYSSLGTFFQGTFVQSISFGVGLVVGAVPYGAATGGARSGVGIAGSIGCGTSGCSVGISVGAIAAALAPGNACPAGPYLLSPPPAGFGCFSSYGATVSVMCCTHNFHTGSSSCR